MPEEKAPAKVFIKMTERTRIEHKGKFITLEQGQIIKCNPQTATDLIKENLATKYEPERTEVLEL